jgi:hypothetical protein
MKLEFPPTSLRINAFFRGFDVRSHGREYIKIYKSDDLRRQVSWLPGSRTSSRILSSTFFDRQYHSPTSKHHWFQQNSRLAQVRSLSLRASHAIWTILALSMHFLDKLNCEKFSMANTRCPIRCRKSVARETGRLAPWVIRHSLRLLMLLELPSSAGMRGVGKSALADHSSGGPVRLSSLMWHSFPSSATSTRLPHLTDIY